MENNFSFSLEESIDYIQNFWLPAPGDQIIANYNPAFYSDENSMIQKIENIDTDYPEQIMIENQDDIRFVQDYMWRPSLEQLDQLIINLGARDYNETLGINGIEMPKPKDFIEYCQTIALIRHYSQLKSN